MSNKQLSVSQTSSNPLSASQAGTVAKQQPSGSLKKNFVTGFSQIWKNFNQGLTFLSSVLWVGSTFAIVFLVPLSAAFAMRMGNEEGGGGGEGTLE